jgi:hypothetical protein
MAQPLWSWGTGPVRCVTESGSTAYLHVRAEYHHVGSGTVRVQDWLTIRGSRHSPKRESMSDEAKSVREWIAVSTSVMCVHTRACLCLCLCLHPLSCPQKHETYLKFHCLTSEKHSDEHREKLQSDLVGRHHTLNSHSQRTQAGRTRKALQSSTWSDSSIRCDFE